MNKHANSVRAQVLDLTHVNPHNTSHEHVMQQYQITMLSQAYMSSTCISNYAIIQITLQCQFHIKPIFITYLAWGCSWDIRKVADHWHILVHWPKKLKRAAQDCGDTLHKGKQRILEEENMEYEVMNSSFPKRIAHASKSFVFSVFNRNNKELSR